MRLKLPTRARRGPRHCAPIRHCSGRGLASRPVTKPLVRSYRTISPLPVLARHGGRTIGCVVSVPLSVGSPRLPVRKRPALWSSDFPRHAFVRRRRTPAHRDRPAYSHFLLYLKTTVRRRFSSASSRTYQSSDSSVCILFSDFPRIRRQIPFALRPFASTPPEGFLYLSEFHSGPSRCA